MYKSLIIIALFGTSLIAGLSSCSSADKKEAEKAENVLKEAAIAETGNAEGEIEDRASQIKKIEEKLEDTTEHQTIKTEIDDTISVAL